MNNYKIMIKKRKSKQKKLMKNTYLPVEYITLYDVSYSKL